MNKLFNLDNPFWNSMDRVFDLFIANVLWLVCCLPVFTIGPSTAAFFYVLINMARGEDGIVSRDFFRSFRQNFRQGAGFGLLMTATGAFLAIDINMCYHSGTGIYTFFMVFFAVLFLLWASVALYSFALLAKFEKKNMEFLVWANYSDALCNRRRPVGLPPAARPGSHCLWPGGKISLCTACVHTEAPSAGDR